MLGRGERIGPGGRVHCLISIRLRRFWTQEVPNKDSVVVGTAHYLELIELKTKYSTRVFDQSSQTKCTIG